MRFMGCMDRGGGLKKKNLTESETVRKRQTDSNGMTYTEIDLS
jgi:hypothetical protein